MKAIWETTIYTCKKPPCNPTRAICVPFNPSANTTWKDMNVSLTKITQQFCNDYGTTPMPKWDVSFATFTSPSRARKHLGNQHVPTVCHDRNVYLTKNIR